LVVGLNWLGDAVMSMPAVQALKASRPGAHLTLLVRKGLAPLWKMHGAPDELLAWPDKGEPLAPLVREIRARRFGEAFVMPNSVRSALPPWRAGIPVRAGAPGHWPRKWLLTETRRTGGGDGVHQGVECMKLFFPDWRGTAADLPAPRLDAPEEARARIRESLAGVPRPWVAMMPGAARGPSKQWPAERYAEAARALAESAGASAVFAGTPAEAPLCEAIRAEAGGRAVSLAGKTSLREMAALLAEADAALCNDSGGMHLAAALGTPVVAVFGITNPAQTGPLGRRVAVLQHSARRTRDVPRVSPEAEAALRAVTAGEAVRAVRGFLGR